MSNTGEERPNRRGSNERKPPQSVAHKNDKAPKIVLISSDQPPQHINIPIRVASLSTFLAKTCKLEKATNEEGYVLSDSVNVRVEWPRALLTRIIEFSTVYLQHGSGSRQIRSWQARLERDTEFHIILFQIVVAAHRLGVIPLFEYSIAKVRECICGQTLACVKEIFDVEDDTESPGELQSYIVVDVDDMTQSWIGNRERSPQRSPNRSEAACTFCKSPFTMTLRRHHCRLCFDVFCGNCANSFKVLSQSEGEMAEKLIQTSAATQWKNYLGNVVTLNSPNLARICCLCARKENSKDEHVRVLKESFELCKLELPDLLLCLNVNETWKQAAEQILHSFRRLQFALPTTKFNEKEAAALWRNRAHLAGHSHWMMQLVKVVEWDARASKERIKQTCDCLKSPRTLSCEDIGCELPCEDRLKAEDGLALLVGYAPVSEDEIRELAVLALMRAPVDEIACYLPLLVHALEDEKNASASSLFAFLLSIAKRNTQFRSNLYWELNVGCNKEGEKDRMFTRLRDRYLIEMTEAIGRDASLQLTRNQDLADLMRSVCGSNERELNDTACLQISDILSAESPLPLFLDTSFLCSQVDLKNIEEVSSHTRPLIIPLAGATSAAASRNDSSVRGTDSPQPRARTSSSELDNTSVDDAEELSSCPSLLNLHTGFMSTRRVMFKAENLRTDQLILNVIKRMDLCLQADGMDLNILTYQVTPTSKSDGFVMIVEDAQTLNSIAKDKRYGSLHNFLGNNNRHRTIGEVQRRFMKSLCAYTIITFLLGVGDRHGDNMMVRRDGTFFHIDYGFVLGEDPKPLLRRKLTLKTFMLEAMGGEGNDLHREFKRIAAKAYNCLRQHAPLFINMLEQLQQLQGGAAYQTQLEEQLKLRFAVGKSNEEAETLLNLWMDEEMDCLKGTLEHLFHEVPKLQEHYTKQVAQGAQEAVVHAGTAIQAGFLGGLKFFTSRVFKEGEG